MANRDRDNLDAGQQGGGQSGGGFYPNPHQGKGGKGRKAGAKSGFLGSGGQTEMTYHGTGQLGDDKVGETADAPAGGKSPKR